MKPINERVPGGDLADRANDLAQEHLDHLLQAARAAAAPEQVQRNGVWEHTECTECGEGLPQARIILGKIRCVDCQTYLERGRNIYMKRGGYA